jgi:acetyl esterase/lipase
MLSSPQFHRTADSLLGGGFAMAGTLGHIKFWKSVQPDLEAAGKPTGFLFVEYTLVPYATYPVQLSEGVEAVQYVVNDLARLPSDLTLAGDSAGANICLAILSHITHPLPGIPTLANVKQLNSMVLLAPWVTFDITQPSAKRNAYKDVYNPEMSAQWGSNYLGGKPATPYADPLIAPAEWWRAARVRQVLSVAGGDELIVDALDLWAERFRVSGSVKPSVSHGLQLICASSL